MTLCLYTRPEGRRNAHYFQAIHPGQVPSFLQRPLVTIQPIQAQAGKPTVDIARLEREVDGIARVLPMIEVQSPEHWAQPSEGSATRWTRSSR